MGEFIDTKKDFSWLDDDGDPIEISKRIHSEEMQIFSEGYERVPDDHAPPQQGYEYMTLGTLIYYRKING